MKVVGPSLLLSVGVFALANTTLLASASVAVTPAENLPENNTITLVNNIRGGAGSGVTDDLDGGTGLDLQDLERGLQERSCGISSTPGIEGLGCLPLAGAGAAITRDPAFLGRGFCSVSEDATGNRAAFIRFMRDAYFPITNAFINMCSVTDTVAGFSGGCVSPCQIMDKLIRLIANPCKRLDLFKKHVKSVKKFEKGLETAKRIPVIKKFAKKIDAAIQPFIDYVTKLANVDKGTPNSCEAVVDESKSKLEKFFADVQKFRGNFRKFNLYASLRVDYMCTLENLETNGKATGQRARSLRKHRMLEQMQTVSEGGNSNETALSLPGSNKRMRRFLAFQEDLLDFEALTDVEDELNIIAKTVKEFRNDINCKIEDFQKSIDFFDKALKPFETVGDILGIMNPVFSVFGDVADKVSFLKCPKFLGFICDLDAIIITVVEKVLDVIGINIDEIVSDLVDRIFISKLPDVDGLANAFPNFDVLFNLDLEDILFGPLKQQMQSVFDLAFTDPLEKAFSPDENAVDVVLKGISLEYRFAKGNLDNIAVNCPVNRIPVTFEASASNACGTKDLSSQLELPCGSKNSCQVNLKPFLSDFVSKCSKDKEFEQDGYGFRAGMMDETTILHTCVLPSDLKQIDAMPSLRQSVSGNMVCTGDQRVLPLGFTVTKGGFDSDRNQPRCDAKARIDGLDKLFPKPSACTGNSCNSGFRNHQCGIYPLFKKRDPSIFKKCRRNRVHALFKVEPAFTCLVDGRDAANDGDAIQINFHLAQKSKTIQTIKPCKCSRSTCFGTDGDRISVPNFYRSAQSNDLSKFQLTCPPNQVIKIVDVFSETFNTDSTRDDSADFKSRCDGKRSCTFDGSSREPSGGLRLYRSAHECICGPGFLPEPDPEGKKCVSCAIGTFRTAAMPNCDYCPAGTFADKEGASQCKQCPAGSYAPDDGSTGCEKCPAGTTGPPGSKSKDDCKPCQAGTFSQEGSETCQKCPSGHFSTTGASECEPVPPGTFNSGGGIEECAPGTFSDTEGSTNCKPCAIGTYSRLPGARRCVDCPFGTYTDRTGAKVCINCPVGTMTQSIGANAKSMCKPPSNDIPSFQSASLRGKTCEELLMIDVDRASVTEDEFAKILDDRMVQVGNGICNGGAWNTEQCGYDGGDCCAESCQIPNLPDDDTADNQFESQLACTWSTYECLDPTFNDIPPPSCDSSNPFILCAVSAEPVPLPLEFSPRNVECDEDREEEVVHNLSLMKENVGDGVCDPSLNTADNKFDGGDCCVQTCKPNPAYPESCLSNCDCVSSSS